MAFWNEASADPKRKYRFLVRVFNQEIAWYAKSVTAPSYEITSVEHAFSDHVFNFPGKIKWSDVEVTLVDPAGGDDVVFKTLEIIKGAGYTIPTLAGVTGDNTDAFKTFTKAQLINPVSVDGPAVDNTLVIETQDALGNTIEEWTLNNAFITNVKFGDFDYSSEDLREISLTFKYDWASCKFGGPTDANALAKAGDFFSKG